MILAAKFPGSCMGRNKLWMGQVSIAAPAVVVTVASAACRAGGAEVVLGAVDDEIGRRREVSAASAGKLVLAGSAVVAGVCCAVAARRETRKWKMRVKRSMMVFVMRCYAAGRLRAMPSWWQSR